MDQFGAFGPGLQHAMFAAGQSPDPAAGATADLIRQAFQTVDD